MEIKIHEDFKPYIEQILALGYRVFVNPNAYNGITYCIIANRQGNIGYCQLGDFGFGVRFSTIHKQGNGIGTGFGLAENQHIFDIKREQIESSFAFAPEWVNASDRKRVKKWTLDEYLNSVYGKCYIEYSEN